MALKLKTMKAKISDIWSIAKFMGVDGNEIIPIASLDYHKNWSLLMEVVEKIDEMGPIVIIGRMFCEIKYTNPLDSTKRFEIKIASGVKMNAIYGAVVEFIKWHEQQKAEEWKH